MAYDETLADRIRAALRGQAGLSEKLMFGGIAFLLNGNMVVGVTRDRLMVRFDPARHDEVLTRPGAAPMDFTHRSSGMRGMVFVSAQALVSEVALVSWIELAAGFVRRLPTKEMARAAATSKTRPLPRPASPDTKPAKRPRPAPAARESAAAKAKTTPLTSKKGAPTAEKGAPVAKKTTAPVAKKAAPVAMKKGAPVAKTTTAPVAKKAAPAPKKRPTTKKAR